jgi:hypothetical protein
MGFPNPRDRLVTRTAAQVDPNSSARVNYFKQRSSHRGVEAWWHGWQYQFKFVLAVRRANPLASVCESFKRAADRNRYFKVHREEVVRNFIDTAP